MQQLMVISGVILGLGIYLISSSLTRYLFLQKIKNIPTSKVNSAAIGLTELFGKASSTEQLYSPITKTKCAYWKLTAEYYEKGKYGGYTSILSNESQSQLFLEDETGKILIDPTGASFDMKTIKQFRGFLSQNPKIDKQALAYINSLPEKTKNIFYNHGGEEISIWEYVIPFNANLYVLGTVESREPPANSNDKLVLTVRRGNLDKFMHVSDKSEKQMLATIPQRVYLELLCGILITIISAFFFIYCALDYWQQVH